MSRQRLDDALVALGHYATRSRARDAVRRGTVRVNGITAARPAQSIGADATVSIADPAQAYVSRGALKLLAALDHFNLHCAGAEALDIGASTGGFTQALLERGAKRVTALDSGHGQLAAALRDDPRVLCREALNARDLAAQHLPAAPQFIVADVSFISLALALPPALALAVPGARLVALIKPQFEAGPALVGRGGLVTDPAVHAAVCERIRAMLADAGWEVTGLMPSPVSGGDGNREFLITAFKTSLTTSAPASAGWHDGC